MKKEIGLGRLPGRDEDPHDKIWMLLFPGSGIGLIVMLITGVMIYSKGNVSGFTYTFVLVIIGFLFAAFLSSGYYSKSVKWRKDLEYTESKTKLLLSGLLTQSGVDEELKRLANQWAGATNTGASVRGLQNDALDSGINVAILNNKDAFYEFYRAIASLVLSSGVEILLKDTLEEYVTVEIH